MLPVRLSPLPDEILSSWIIRLAIANGTDPLGIGYGIWGEWRGWARDIDRHLPRKYLKNLHALTGEDMDRIESMTLVHTPSVLSHDGTIPPHSVKWPGIIPLGTRNRARTNGLHFCPKCLQEEIPYAKKEWRASWACTCPKHENILLLRCPKCHYPFSPHLIDYLHPKTFQCTQCGFDLRGADTKPADPLVVRLQKKFSDTILSQGGILDLAPSGISGEQLPSLYDFYNGLMRFFRYCDAVSHIEFEPICHELIGESPPPTFRERITSVEMLPSEDRHFYGHLIAKVWEEGIEAFVDLLLDQQITYSNLSNSALYGKRVSKIIMQIAMRLPQSPQNKRRRKRTWVQRPIEPLSSNGVELLMQSLREKL